MGEIVVDNSWSEFIEKYSKENYKTWDISRLIESRQGQIHDIGKHFNILAKGRHHSHDHAIIRIHCAEIIKLARELEWFVCRYEELDNT